ncbi:MAG TPA: hypothetical protein VLZ12_11360 [Verrucomicrobiae bacterium]|nr:hypothetical protein [Verrucomicrobiae bacterium]
MDRATRQRLIDLPHTAVADELKKDYRLHVGQELRKLRRDLGDEATLLVGGRAAVNDQRIIEEIGAIRVNDIPQLRLQLDLLRTTVNQAPRRKRWSPRYESA